MAYIGYNPSQLAVAPFAVKSFTGNGSTTTFTLDQSVPGANEANVEVFVENVQQSPIDAYTIGGALNNSLIFSEAPVSGAVIYVIHKGESTYNLQPSTGSVTAATLDPVLRNFTVDNFTGNGSATTYTLTDIPYSANSILVTVDGIVQTASTNYTVSGTTLSFGSSAPDTGAVITVVHMGFSSGNKAVMDGSITPVKLSTGGPSWTSTGSVGIGSSSLTGYSLRVSKNITGGAGSYGIINDGTIQSDVTVVAYGIRSNLSTAASAFTLANLRHYDATQSTIGAGSTVNNQVGFFVDNSLIGATNNYGFFGNIPSAANRWNLYMNGTADNYMNGNLGIGTNSPAVKLDIAGAGTATTQLIWSRGNADASFVSSLRTGDAGTNAYQSTIGVDYAGYTDFARIKFYRASTLGEIHFFTGGLAGNGNEKMRIDGNGVLTLPFGQIKFPAAQNASADANTLDDYEEGTFTPGVAFGGASVGITYSGRSGIYTKIGRNVYYTFGIALTSKGSSTGTVTITGFPYASGSGKSYREDGTRCGQYAAVTSDMTLWVQNSLTAFIIINPFNGQAMSDTSFANNSSIFFCGYYVAD